MKHIDGVNRNQIQMLALEEMVAENSFVRIIDTFVDSLDFEKFEFSNFKLNYDGRPPFHPGTLLKIYLYGYHNGIRSCRKLEKACKVNIEMMWLIEGRQPGYKTIADFRKKNKKSFKDVFRYFVLILKSWDLIGGETIAIDSFKIRAQNSLKNNFNDNKIKRHLKYIDSKIEEYEKQLEEEDNIEIRKKKENKEEKKKQYLQLQKQLSQSNDGQISTTDPDARAVVFQRNSVKVGYNIQAASDAKHNLLIAADTGDVNDTKALSPMIKQTQENLNSLNQSINVLADKGYHSGREIKEAESLNATTYLSPKKSSSAKKNPEYAMPAFTYDPINDTYTCPEGRVLDTNGRWYNKKLNKGRKSYMVKHYKTKACKECPVRSKCTKNKLGRIIERTEYAEYVKKNNERVNNNPNYYRQRQQIIEHQFGTLKRQWNFDHTLMKGKENVMAEVYINFTLYNLRRSMSILGFKELLKRIKSLFSVNFRFLVSLALLRAEDKLFSDRLQGAGQWKVEYSYI